VVSLVLQGELLLARPEAAQAEAEACFSEALAVVPRRQPAKSWELRTVTSLVRLWRQQNRMQDAHELLACPFPDSPKGLYG
jgi:predicted ATPase